MLGFFRPRVTPCVASSPGVCTALTAAAFLALLPLHCATYSEFTFIANSIRSRTVSPASRFLSRRTSRAAYTPESSLQNRAVFLSGEPSHPPSTSKTTLSSVRTPQRQISDSSEAAEEAARKIMAWRSHGRTNAELVQNLRSNGVFKDQRVYDTMLKVDRGFFVSTDPYADSPQPIGFDATISAPHMHAVALEEMADKLVFGNRALDVGSGTGYLTVCMALMVGADQEGGGTAVGIDYKQGLVDLSRRNVHASFPDLLKRPSFQLVVGNGWAGGPSVGAPYDAIHVGAAAQAVPAALLQQLAPGGVMVIPVECRRGKISIEGEGDRQLPGESYCWGQVLVALRKHADGKTDVKYVTSVMYVPLVKPHA